MTYDWYYFHKDIIQQFSESYFLYVRSNISSKTYDFLGKIVCISKKNVHAHWINVHRVFYSQLMILSQGKKSYHIDSKYIFNQGIFKTK